MGTNYSNDFRWDVFLSYSGKNRDLVRDIAQRLKLDGTRVWFDEWEIRSGERIQEKIENGLEHSRVLVLCMSAEESGTELIQLENHTYRFKDPLNSSRRFIRLRLDDTFEKGSLAQPNYIDWRPDERENEYPKLLRACHPSPTHDLRIESGRHKDATTSQLKPVWRDPSSAGDGTIYTCEFSTDRKNVLIGGQSNDINLIDVATGNCQIVLTGHTDWVTSLHWSANQRLAVSGSHDECIRLWELQSGACVRVFEGHQRGGIQVALNHDDTCILSGARDNLIRLWDVSTGHCLRVMEGHTNQITRIVWIGKSYAVSGSVDKTLRLWNVETGECINVLHGHEGEIWAVAASLDGRRAASSGSDRTVRVWDLEKGNCQRVLEGHTSLVCSLAWDRNSELILSGAIDGSLRLWNNNTGAHLRDFAGRRGSIKTAVWDSNGGHVISCDEKGGISIWDVTTVNHDLTSGQASKDATTPASSTVQYTNAKVLLVGNSTTGKTGLSNRLALGIYEKTDSTVGAWATQWRLSLPEDDAALILNSNDNNNAIGDQSDDRLMGAGSKGAANAEREIWLWDFGGQADQQLIHHLYMDLTQVATLVFDPQLDDCLETLGQWDRDLSRVDKDKPQQDKMTKLLVAGRCDTGGLRIARSQIDDFVEKRGFAGYYPTSAKNDEGCEELKKAIIDSINWKNIPWRSSPVLFKRLKDEIVSLKDTGRVLYRFNELRELLSLRMQGENTVFTDTQLTAVIDLLAGPAVVWKLKFGSWILLQPERINSYAQAVIRTIREDEYDRGCIAEKSVLDGDLTYHSSVERLPKDEEQFVLLALHQVLVERGLCIRHQTESGEILLIFPSYYRRERQEPSRMPMVEVSYTFNGFLDEIYATLVVKLHHTAEFTHDNLWRNAADFKTNASKETLGLRLIRKSMGQGVLQVFFSEDMPVAEKIIFSKYIHEHLLQSSNDVRRFRHYVCLNQYRGNPCGTTANRDVAMERLEESGESAELKCQRCDATLQLWDELEDLFADKTIRERVRNLRDAVRIKLDTESKERVLVGEIISTVALADQICREVQISDKGIDVEIEFKDDNGDATSKKVYLQLKSGDSFLQLRKKDEALIFRKFNWRQAKYWMNHEYPVVLVIRNSKGEIHWMEIRDHLREITNNGKDRIRQIVFNGKRLDVMTIRGWRDQVIHS